MNLTTEQTEIVAHRHGNLLVRARAGTGKTTTLTAHTKALILGGVRPRGILVTTFSKRGANDMKAKAKALGVPAGVAYRTLHGTAYMILLQARENAAKRRETEQREAPGKIEVVKGWKMRFVLQQEIERAAKALGLAKDAKGRPAGMSTADVAREIGLAKAALVETTTWSTEDGVVFPAYETWATTRGREPLPEGPAKLVAAVYAAVEKVKRNPAAYDEKFAGDAGTVWLTFDDMVAATGKGALQNAHWIRPWRGSFTWVMVDEVQDNNIGQWALARYLSAGQNLVAIGDDAQSIFGFRGATPALMQEQAERTKTVNLTNNFRSQPEILERANRLLRLTEGFKAGTELKAGLVSTGAAKMTVATYEKAADEARAVMEGIKVALEAGQDPEEVAVLYRTNAQAGALEVAALKAGLRYRIAGTSFFERAEVQTTVGYLRLVLDRGDQGAWERVYNTPLRRLGRAFLADYPTLAQAEAGVRNGSMKAGYQRGVRKLLGHLDTLAGLVETNFAEAVTYIAEEIGVRKHFRDEDAGDEDETEADEISEAITACAATLGSALALVDFAADMNGEKRPTADKDGVTVGGPTRMITLSTAHRSKGLEWEVTYLVGISGGVFPHAMAPAEEEVRLAYVTFTRAKREVHASCTRVSHTGHEAGPSPLLLAWATG